jgi:hypothetical protein
MTELSSSISETIDCSGTQCNKAFFANLWGGYEHNYVPPTLIQIAHNKIGTKGHSAVGKIINVTSEAQLSERICCNPTNGYETCIYYEVDKPEQEFEVANQVNITKLKIVKCTVPTATVSVYNVSCK